MFYRDAVISYPRYLGFFLSHPINLIFVQCSHFESALLIKLYCVYIIVRGYHPNPFASEAFNFFNDFIDQSRSDADFFRKAVDRNDFT